MGPSQILHALKICQDALRSQAASEQKYMKYQGRVKQPQRELQCSGKDIMWHIIIVELRTPATPGGVGGGKERGGCHLNLRTWHAEGRRPILGLCWPSLGLCWPILRLCWPILRLCWPMPMRTKCCNLQHFALWDGKNPCKYNSFSPRKWLKHSYLQSFVHITIFDFLKNV